MIVGLGNPGRQYERTPHNVGFLVADALTERWDLRRGKDRFRAHLADGRIPARDGTRGPHVAVLSPQTFMNDAGRSVGPARGALHLDLDRLLVIHDDIDLPFGDVRTRLGGGLAGHNGLKSIRSALGSPDFMRIRVGVGRPDSTDPEIVSAHVLGAFRQSPPEVADLVARAVEAAERAVLGDSPESRPEGAVESARIGEDQGAGRQAHPSEKEPPSGNPS